MKRLGPYQLIERLGVGGMAEVFLAHVRRQGEVVQPCVVKVLHSELAADKSFIRLLLEEARLIAQLRHNNIASLYDVGRHEDAVFFVMEYVEGRDLHAVLSHSVRQERTLPIAFAMHVARNLCTGLLFAHTRHGLEGQPLHLVHRDISPQNVLISLLGEVKLIDFGVAKFNSKLRETTRAGVIKGKFGYMSPEQAWDETLDHRSDLFSVGICLYEMLTGRSVYGQSDDALQMLRRAREADIDPVSRWRPDIPEDLADIVHRALQRKREDRFQNAHQFERALALAIARHAPDYTSLDAGALIQEIFDREDPAIQALSPRLMADQAPPRFSFNDEADLVEQTHPMTEVPEAVKQSGAFQSIHAADEHSAAPDDATRELTFSEKSLVSSDFANEKTELFDEARVSGVHRAIERGARGAESSSGAHIPIRARKARGRDAARNTRKIQEQFDALHSDSHPQSPDIARSGAHPNLGASDEYSLDYDDVEVQQRAPISRTSRLGTIANPPGPEQADRPTSPGPGEATSTLSEIFQRRSVQIGAAASFVVIALIFLLTRLF